VTPVRIDNALSLTLGQPLAPSDSAMTGSAAVGTSRGSTSGDSRGPDLNWTSILRITSIGPSSDLHRLRTIVPSRYWPHAERMLPFSHATDSMGLR
jgi:hypothetical protein